MPSSYERIAAYAPLAWAVCVAGVSASLACGSSASLSGSDDGGGSAPATDSGDSPVPPTMDAGFPPGAEPSPDAGTPPGRADASVSDAEPPGALDPNAPPGVNFDLSLWQLQEPVGSPGSPTTFSPAQLAGPNGHQDIYFFTDPGDGAMTFWDPENGVTTMNSSYPRSELREMTSSGVGANWLSPGTHTLSATVKANLIPDHVAVGQIHLGTGTPASTKPLLELFYYATGEIVLSIEQTPAGNNSKPYKVGNVAPGTVWSYVIGLSGNTISLVINGGTTQTFAMSSTFDQEGMYFKAGDYDQSVDASAPPSAGAKVQFYALSIFHGP
jgi:hypothetical protein